MTSPTTPPTPAADAPTIRTFQVFPDVPAQKPEAILRAHGMKADPPRTLDAAKNLKMTTWRR